MRHNESNLNFVRLSPAPHSNLISTSSRCSPGYLHGDSDLISSNVVCSPGYTSTVIPTSFRRCDLLFVMTSWEAHYFKVITCSFHDSFAHMGCGHRASPRRSREFVFSSRYADSTPLNELSPRRGPLGTHTPSMLRTPHIATRTDLTI